jgi:hypothetical protein
MDTSRSKGLLVLNFENESLVSCPYCIFHAVRVKIYGKIIIKYRVLEMSLKSHFNTLQYRYYFKMVSPTIQQISMNKQAIFEGSQQILLFCRGSQIIFCNFEKYIGARTMDQ